MKFPQLFTPLAVVIGIAGVACPSGVQAETRVSCSTLPAAVMEQAKKEAPDATVKGCVKDRENGKTTYEVETMDRGKSRDLLFDPQGTLMEVEQEVDRASLPAPVADAISKAAHGSEVGKVESVTRGGAVASYETTIIRKGKRTEVAFSPEGAPMKAD